MGKGRGPVLYKSSLLHILTNTTMYREAGARRRVYFNPQHAYMHTRGVQPKTWSCLGSGNDAKYRQVHPREAFVFGRSQWRNLGPMHSY